MEMSSKRPVSRFRQIVEIPKSVNILNILFLNSFNNNYNNNK